jgi:DNA-binding CsgD family transcriptional regulator
LVDSGSTALLESLLALIAEPAFVVTDAGRILNANAMGNSVLSQDSQGTRLSLIRIATGQGDPSWSLAPLRGNADLHRFLAVHRPDPIVPPSAECISIAKRRWGLTARQHAVLELVACGLTNADIADRLGVQQRTVEFHVSCIFDKAGVDNRTTLLARVFELRKPATDLNSEAKANAI